MPSPQTYEATTLPFSSMSAMRHELILAVPHEVQRRSAVALDASDVARRVVGICAASPGGETVADAERIRYRLTVLAACHAVPRRVVGIHDIAVGAGIITTSPSCTCR